MDWKRFRLELAPSPEFPTGSASRAYVIHAPLDEDGTIDQDILQVAPHRARVQRQWPNEPDSSGHLVHTPEGWAISYLVGGKPAERAFQLESGALRVGEYANVTEPDGRQQRYRIVSVS